MHVDVLHPPPEPPGLRARQHQLLADLDLLDVPADAHLDAVTRLATAMTGYPVALINVLDTSRACQLSLTGMPEVDLARDDSLCHRASLLGGVVVSGDCAADPRFADLPWVDGRLGSVRRYAMAPLEVDGVTVGTLCVLDEAPGPALGEEGRARLADLASVTVELLERHRRVRRAEAARTDLARTHDALACAHAELATTHDELVRARAFEGALLEALPVGVVAAGQDGAVALFNGVSHRWHGTTPEGGTAPDSEEVRSALFEADGVTPLPLERTPLLRVFAEGPVRGAEIVIRPAGRAPRSVECTGAPVRGADGRLLGAVVAMADVTAQRALELRLREAATRDVLTGLPNRALLVDRLGVALASAERTGDVVAVLYGDLDGFKRVNDTQGHAAGDAVLVEVAARLSAAMRQTDTVARIGGDEFVVLCPSAQDAAAVDAVVRRLVEAVSAPVSACGGEHRVGISIGTALSSEHAGVDGLLSAADAAMYAVKRARAGSGSSARP